VIVKASVARTAGSAVHTPWIENIQTGVKYASRLSVVTGLVRFMISIWHRMRACTGWLWGWEWGQALVFIRGVV
jgi:hypothetical protein